MAPLQLQLGSSFEEWVQQFVDPAIRPEPGHWGLE